MYLQYYGLRENPFSIPPDPQYLYLSRSHQEALAHLQYGLGENGGFVQLTGEVGTGKTLLIRALVERLPEDVDVALILYPVLTVADFVAAICDELRVPHRVGHASLKQLIDALNSHLLTTHARGRRTVLIIDEAQNLSREVLEQIRLLTNLETTKQKLLKIILIGQPELSSLLAQQDLRQLAQRITARYHLVALTRKETFDYIVHRCRVAGAKAILFNRHAMERVYAVSGGLPRLINVICDRSLLGAYVREKAVVDEVIVRNAAAEVGLGGMARERLGIRVLVPLSAAAVLLIVGIWQFPVLVKYFSHEDRMAVASVSTVGSETKSLPVTGEAVVVEQATGSKATPVSSSNDGMKQGNDPNYVNSLETMLTRSEAVTDTESAMKSLFERWGLDYTALSGATGCERALNGGLHCIFQTGTWNNLRSYNRPAVIELQGADGRKHHVLVASLTDESVSLEMGGHRREYSVGEVDRFWFGKYLLLWRPPAPEQEMLWIGDRGEAVIWVRDALARSRGEPLAVDANDVFDKQLEAQVREFQRRQQLAVDGVVGRVTQARLQGYLSPDKSPRLSTDNVAVETR